MRSTIREFKLAGAAGDGRHAYLNQDGAFIGCGVPLLERDPSSRWRPRDQTVLERLLAKGYGVPVELGWRMTQLRNVAHALNSGDLALASISLVHTKVPPLPSSDHAREMAKADGLLLKYNPNWGDEARAPRGNSAGGQWASEAADTTDGASGKATASGQGETVTIVHPDGTSEVRRGGTAAWRNNNSGNLAAKPFSFRHGAIGSDANGFAIFPDEPTGTAAQRALLMSPCYRDLTMDAAIETWADRKHNDTPRYQSLVRRWTGMSGDTRIRDMTPDQLTSLMAAQRRMEGWLPGTVERGARP
jgi:hypothetical protein